MAVGSEPHVVSATGAFEIGKTPVAEELRSRSSERRTTDAADAVSRAWGGPR